MSTFRTSLTNTPATGNGIPADHMNHTFENTLALKQGDQSFDKVTDAGAEYNTGVQNITLTSGSNNDVTINAGTRIVRLTPDAGGTSAITGLTGGATGRELSVINITTNSYSVSNNSGSSSAANRIICHGNANKSRGAADGFDLWYDATSSLWRMKG